MLFRSIFGIGFPPFLGGPFRYMDQLGLKNVVKKLELLMDELGEQGIRCNALGSYGVTIDQWRMINGDLMNGVMYNNGSLGMALIDESGAPAAFNALQYAQSVTGSLLIPTFNLSLGDVNLVVDSSAATTRKYFPIITVPIGGRQKTEQVQQARLAGNTSKAILSNDLQ